MGLIRRLLGICVTDVPKDSSCWKVADPEGKLEVDLTRAPELTSPGGALRLEGGDLDQRILVIHGVDGRYHAYQNACACSGWRLDPVADEEKVRCCTLAASTYDYDGRKLSGPATKDLKTLAVDVDEERRLLLIARR